MAFPERSGELRESIDPDVESQRARRGVSSQLPVVAVVAAGGGIGAASRHGAEVVWPTISGGFPWTILAVNIVGCALIGVFMVLIAEVWAAHRLVRPFVGTGILGGFTTFSTYAVDIQQLIADGHPGIGLGYLTGTVGGALVAVWLAAMATRRLILRRTT